jgi:hypothetical protein
VPTRRFDAFVSAVTSECGLARDAVAAELRKLDLHVAVQSDFTQLSPSLSRALSPSLSPVVPRTLLLPPFLPLAPSLSLSSELSLSAWRSDP